MTFRAAASAALAVVALTAAGGCSGDQEAQDRLARLAGLVREGERSGTTSQSDPTFDGPPSVIVEAEQPGDLGDVTGRLTERLGGAGFTLTCPGGDDETDPPAGQERGSDPRQRCGLSGDATGTVWFSTLPGQAVSVSVLAGA